MDPYGDKTFAEYYVIYYLRITFEFPTDHNSEITYSFFVSIRNYLRHLVAERYMLLYFFAKFEISSIMLADFMEGEVDLQIPLKHLRKKNLF